MVKKLISNLLVVNRHRRYTAVDVLCDPFVLTLGGSQTVDERLDELRQSRRADLQRRRADLQRRAKQNRLSFKHAAVTHHG